MLIYGVLHPLLPTKCSLSWFHACLASHIKMRMTLVGLELIARKTNEVHFVWTMFGVMLQETFSKPSLGLWIIKHMHMLWLLSIILKSVIHSSFCFILDGQGFCYIYGVYFKCELSSSPLMWCTVPGHLWCCAVLYAVSWGMQEVSPHEKKEQTLAGASLQALSIEARDTLVCHLLAQPPHHHAFQTM